MKKLYGLLGICLATSAPLSLQAAGDCTYGPNTCIQGYVWRESTPNDLICVTPQNRTQTRIDNSLAASRWTNGAYGPQTCISGYVWREAYPGDKVCVTPQIRQQAAYDNSQAAARKACW